MSYPRYRDKDTGVKIRAIKITNPTDPELFVYLARVKGTEIFLDAATFEETFERID